MKLQLSILLFVPLCFGCALTDEQKDEVGDIAGDVAYDVIEESEKVRDLEARVEALESRVN